MENIKREKSQNFFECFKFVPKGNWIRLHIDRYEEYQSSKKYCPNLPLSIFLLSETFYEAREGKNSSILKRGIEFFGEETKKKILKTSFKKSIESIINHELSKHKELHNRNIFLLFHGILTKKNIKLLSYNDLKYFFDIYNWNSIVSLYKYDNSLKPIMRRGVLEKQRELFQEMRNIYTSAVWLEPFIKRD